MAHGGSRGGTKRDHTVRVNDKKARSPFGGRKPRRLLHPMFGMRSYDCTRKTKQVANELYPTGLRPAMLLLGLQEKLCILNELFLVRLAQALRNGG